MSRDLESLVRVIREELRAEGVDGAGYSDFFIEEKLNTAQQELAGVFTIRDTLTFTTIVGVGTYDLLTVVDAAIENIMSVFYDELKLSYMSFEDYLHINDPAEGSVNRWTLWGNSLMLTGEVEADKTVELFVTRAPKALRERGDVSELPVYADEAIIQYVLSACYRLSRDYDRANYHYGTFRMLRSDLSNRGTPQVQREKQNMMKDSYWSPVNERGWASRSDTNPGGRSD